MPPLATRMCRPAHSHCRKGDRIPRLHRGAVERQRPVYRQCRDRHRLKTIRRGIVRVREPQVRHIKRVRRVLGDRDRLVRPTWGVVGANRVRERLGGHSPRLLAGGRYEQG